MICLKRNIFNNNLIVYIDAELYMKNARIFNCLFATFDIIECSIIFDGTIYIHPIHNGAMNERITQYDIECDLSNNQWVLLLIGLLEEWYANMLQCTVVHGSCIRLNEKNILLIGERKSGKTTLTKYLVFDKDAVYLDDDCVYFINNEYHGFNMPISLRQSIDTSTDNNVICSTIDGERIIRTLLEPRASTKSLSKMDLIVFPKYNTREINNIERVEKGRLYNKVINNIRNSYDLNSLFTDINQIVRAIDSYSINYTDSENAYRQILTIMNRGNEHETND